MVARGELTIPEGVSQGAVQLTCFGECAEQGLGML